jgi:hypothetical protein
MFVSLYIIVIVDACKTREALANFSRDSFIVVQNAQNMISWQL